jgi:hypothetical protein
MPIFRGQVSLRCWLELIRFSHTHIRMLDVTGLKAIACECDETVRSELEQLEGGTVR